MSAPALEAVDVTRSYVLEGGVGVDALRGVSLTIGQGDYVAVVGPSGSGKSTLMHLLGALDRPTTGSLRIGGRDVAGMSQDELARVRNETIGFVFQAFALLARTSAVDNVSMPLVYRGVRRGERRRRAEAALARVGMAHRLGHRPNQLSGGEQQRVAIARAVVNKPPILLADEPTGNLDPATSLDIVRLLDRINRSGTTIVMATHDDEIVDSFRKRVVELDEGALVRDDVGGEYGTGTSVMPQVPPVGTDPDPDETGRLRPRRRVLAGASVTPGSAHGPDMGQAGQAPPRFRFRRK